MVAPSRPAPLSAVLPLTFLSSMSCGMVSTGIYFLTKHGYHFSAQANFALGLVQGVAYTSGAVAAGAVTVWLRRRGCATRTMLLFVLLALGALCTLPFVWPAAASIWVMMALYSPLNGMLWPMVESYVSGGRREAELRRTLGAWNVTWAFALTLSFAGVSPLCEGHPALALLLLGGVHLASVLTLLGLPEHPAAHLHESHVVPPSYRGLLVTFRGLLPLTTFLLSALGATLPIVFSRLGVRVDLASLLACAWLGPRALTFFVMMRWEGWHGSVKTAWVGAACLLAGFGAGLGSGLLGESPVALAICVLGLVTYGAGMAIVYKGALYYALEVGNAEVGAGGGHETLIGFGFAAGPALGLCVATVVQDEAPMLGWAAALTLLAAVVVCVRSLRVSRRS